MKKIVAVINMTVDGYCDHTAISPDEEVHQHYTELLRDADEILYGRITYQLMEFWQTLVENPSGERSLDDFAIAIDNISKIVFSNSLKNVEWQSAEVATKPLEVIVQDLKQQPGKNVLVGSRSLIVTLLNLSLIDELQLCIHPVISGKGLPLFENISGRKVFKMLNIKYFKSGAVIHYYSFT
jgi:dihydrofolate reductase